MATEKLSVENFGPIQKADLDLRKVTVLIGEQASGKSVLAKLATIVRNENTLGGHFENELEKHKISSYSTPKSVVFYENNLFKVSFKNEILKNDISDNALEDALLNYNEIRLSYNEISLKLRSEGDILIKKNLREDRRFLLLRLGEAYAIVRTFLLTETYIPAERMIVSFLNDHIFDFDTQFSKIFSNSLLQFAELFNISKYSFSGSKLLAADLVYKFEADLDKFELPNGEILQINEVSTGIQTLIPLQAVIESKIDEKEKILFIVEEPELNLFPTIQNKLVQYLIEKCTKGDNRLIITTHSPYILTALSNLIEAKNVVKQNPDLHDAVAQIIPPQYWLDFDDVSAYFVGGGTAYSIRDEENQNIDANPIDAVSNETGRIFDQLLDLKYATTA